jgi:uncharacterized protein (DUF433 family)
MDVCSPLKSYRFGGWHLHFWSRPRVQLPRGKQLFCAGVSSVVFCSMALTHLTDRITVDPDICFGKPCIMGTRIGVADVLDNLAAGASAQDIIDDFPELTQQDISAALSYAAAMASRSIVIAA